jgi:hypothetical protein
VVCLTSHPDLRRRAPMVFAFVQLQPYDDHRRSRQIEQLPQCAVFADALLIPPLSISSLASRKPPE